MYCSNYNLNDIVTPINVTVLKQMLEQAKYDENKSAELVDGFQNGFDIGYRGENCRQDMSKNILLTIGTKTDLWNKIMKEVKLGRYAGPSDQMPYDHFMQSPIGLVPKAGNKMRLIFHLSYDFSETNTSLNANTPRDMCSVKYKNLDYAIMTCLELLKHKPSEDAQLHYSKTDVQSAFRVLPIKIKQRCWLVMMAEDPLTGE